jgi:hypothetical protein
MQVVKRFPAFTSPLMAYVIVARFLWRPQLPTRL